MTLSGALALVDAQRVSSREFSTSSIRTIRSPSL